MNPFLLPPRERLGSWRTLRTNLPEMDETAQLMTTAGYWSQAPLVNFAYDPEHPETWLSPWEMIDENLWCRNSIAIGMEFTLRLSGWDASRLVLKLIRDLDISDQMFVLEVDGARYLNYEFQAVTPIPDTKRMTLATIQHQGRAYVHRDE